MSSAGLASLLPLPVAIPLCGAVAAPLLARLSGRLPVIVSVLAAGRARPPSCWPRRRTVFAGRVIAHYMGHWTPVSGHVLGIAFAADPFGLLFALAAAVVGAVLLLYTLSELGGLGRRELGWFACLFQLLLAALIGAALTADLFNLFVWFEVAALASYGLHRLLPGAADRAGGRVQDPGADQAGQLRHLHRRRAAVCRARRAELRPAARSRWPGT